MSRREAGTAKRLRCAIYTRKSTEEGLDQDFNSLHAQFDACAAYIASQRHEGWALLPGRYDDGGFTGGNMERPGLQRLLADVRAGRIDVIVVYKVDRLTRSLTDFAKIVEALDGAEASFVSITQSFNTTTSMGRLTLNMLLSFAQFEREVISERVHDKVAASKARGMWMGGVVPLGYDVRDRKLVVNEAEAETVRYIYQRYLELKSVRALSADLGTTGICTKVHRTKDRSEKGGQVFSRGALYHLLKNRLYLGEVSYRGKIYAGEHQAIVDRELFDPVQQLLEHNATDRSSGKPRFPSERVLLPPGDRSWGDGGELLTGGECALEQLNEFWVAIGLPLIRRCEYYASARTAANDLHNNRNGNSSVVVISAPYPSLPQYRLTRDRSINVGRRARELEFHLL